MHRFRSYNAGNVLSAHQELSADDHRGIHTAHGCNLQQTAVLNVSDDQANLVHVSAHHQVMRGTLCALFLHQQIPQRVDLPRNCGVFLQRMAHIVPHSALVAGNGAQIAKFLEMVQHDAHPLTYAASSFPVSATSSVRIFSTGVCMWHSGMETVPARTPPRVTAKRSALVPVVPAMTSGM